jgi:LysM repeat protein
MTPCTRHTAVIALVICLALPAWGQQYLLYAPQPVTSGQKTSSQDGVLVQEIEIQKGDTLYNLSRKFSGHGTYFPQILLFNSIKNPDLIYAGSTLKVPVTQKAAQDSDGTGTKSTGASRKPKASGDKKTSSKTEEKPTAVQKTNGSSPALRPSTELSLSDLKTVGAAKTGINRQKRKAAIAVKKNQIKESTVVAVPPPPLPSSHNSAVSDDAAGQKLFEAAVKAYRQNDCHTALEQLDLFLANNSGSPLAADANLYKAECYLKLSAQ